MNFSTNQVMQFYALEGVSAAVKKYPLENAVVVTFTDAASKEVRVSDKIENVIWGKLTTADALAKHYKSVTITLADAMKGADVFVGVSRGNLVSEEMVASMNEKPIILAMANPTPEIMPDKAVAAGAYIVGTGRSDFPNQINNVLVFPGIFKGALKVRATDITESMKLTAAKAIASVITDEELNPEYIIPDPFDPRVADVVSNAVAEEAVRLGINRI